MTGISACIAQLKDQLATVKVTLATNTQEAPKPDAALIYQHDSNRDEPDNRHAMRLEVSRLSCERDAAERCDIQVKSIYPFTN